MSKYKKQFIIMNNNNDNQKNHSGQDLTFKEARTILRQFVRQRDWDKYHTPRNLVMALMGEVGEIAEIFQWKGEVQNGLVGFSEKEKIHVGEQIADVLSYLIRLSDVCNIDIETALKDKLAKNKKKYPSEQIRANQNLFFQIKQQRRVKREAVLQGSQSTIQAKNQQQKEVNNQQN